MDESKQSLNLAIIETSFATMTKLSFAQKSLEDLDSEDRERVLGIIDQFRELGVNEDISLPQVFSALVLASHF